jgi:hypothetical protein
MLLGKGKPYLFEMEMMRTIRHPEVLGAQRRASKGARYEAVQPSPFEGRFAATSG